MRKLLVLAALTLAAPVSAQKKPAGATDVAEALAACQAITTQTWLELKDLREAGWEYPVKRGNGRQSQVVKGLYTKKGNDALIVIGKEELDKKSCVVNALLADTASYSSLLQELSGLVGMPNRQEGYTYFWTIADKEIRVDPAGDANRPIARFEVTAIPQESAE